MNKRNFVHSSGGWEPKIKVPADSVSGESHFLVQTQPVFSVSPHVAARTKGLSTGDKGALCDLL